MLLISFVLSDDIFRELQEKLANRKRFCADLEAIQRAQKLWQEQERRETEEENRRIVQYLKERDAKLDAEQVKDRTRKQQANVLAERMCAELDDIEVSDSGHNNIVRGAV